jgi:glycosyltransferase involved in cell wall biosynthesis
MPAIKKKFDNVKFIIVGQGTYEAELRQIVEDAGVEDSVIFEGWIDYQYVPYYIDRCQVGVVPHKAIPGWHTTIPNKLFDFMKMGKPVIVSDVLATSRIVNEEKCGVVFKDADIDSFVEAVERLICSEDRKKIGESGHRAVLEKYNWDFDSATMKHSLIRLG